MSSSDAHNLELSTEELVFLRQALHASRSSVEASLKPKVKALYEAAVKAAQQPAKPVEPTVVPDEFAADLRTDTEVEMLLELFTD